MTALGMRVALSRLRKAHGIAPPTPRIAPLAPPTQYNQIIIGYAATTDVDFGRQKFRPYAFGNVRLADPSNTPLYYKHDQTREVGTIQSLSYDQHGALLITATVTCPVARRACAFSVGATVVDYELVDADSPNFFALIKHATLTEISLTDAPADPAALVTSRRDVCAEAELYGHAVSAITLIAQIIQLIQKGAESCRI